MTSFVGGAIGAGVPKPFHTKRAKDSTSKIRPRSTSAAPAKRSASKPKKAGLSCQSAMDHGTRPTIVPGAITKKSKEPRAAQNRLMRFLPRNLRATRRAGRCYIIEEHDLARSLSQLVRGLHFGF